MEVIVLSPVTAQQTSPAELPDASSSTACGQQDKYSRIFNLVGSPRARNDFQLFISTVIEMNIPYISRFDEM